MLSFQARDSNYVLTWKPSYAMYSKTYQAHLDPLTTACRICADTWSVGFDFSGLREAAHRQSYHPFRSNASCIERFGLLSTALNPLLMQFLALPNPYCFDSFIQNFLEVMNHSSVFLSTNSFCIMSATLPPHPRIPNLSARTANTHSQHLASFSLLLLSL